MLEGLSNYSGEADRELGTKEFNGTKARGFVIEAKKIDPNVSAGTVEIWIDAESNLPAEIRFEMKLSGYPLTLRFGRDDETTVEIHRKNSQTWGGY